MYRDDAEAARLRIAALEAEAAELRRENDALRGSPRARPPARTTIVPVIATAIVIAGTITWATAASRAARPTLRAPAAASAPVVPSAPAEALLTAAPDEVVATTSDDVPAVDLAPAIDPIAAAIEPAHPDVIDVITTREHGGELFVLHRLRGALAWEHAERDRGTLDRTLADYEDRLTICEDGAEDDMASVRCALEEAPSRWIGLRDAVCEDVHSIEVAHLSRGDDGWVLRARAPIVSAVCTDRGSDGAAELRASDVDRDGHAELTVIAPFAVPTSSYDQDEHGTIGAVLDSRDLHPQLVVLRHYDASWGDIETSTRSLATTWNLDDRDGDGSIEAHVRQRIAETDDVGRDTEARTADCPYDRATDRWACAERWIVDLRAAAFAGTELGDVEILGDAPR